MKIVITGAGNVGYHLAKRFNQYREINLLVINHMQNKVLEKLSNLGISTQHNFDSIPLDADAYIITVKDEYIKNTATLLKNKVSENSTVIHTSGAIESDVLQVFKNYGVIYPLHSFLHTEENLNWKNIPVYTIANNTTSANIIQKISKYLNPNNITEIDDKTKLQIHLLAVFGNNFINALLQCMYVLSQKNINLYQNNFNLILQTIERAKHKNPKELQTGPAVRFDNNSIEKHLLYLSEYPEIKKIYQCLTDYIQNNIANEQTKK